MPNGDKIWHRKRGQVRVIHLEETKGGIGREKRNGTSEEGQEERIIRFFSLLIIISMLINAFNDIIISK